VFILKTYENKFSLGNIKILLEVLKIMLLLELLDSTKLYNSYFLASGNIDVENSISELKVRYMYLKLTADDISCSLRNHFSFGRGWAVTEAVIVTLSPGRSEVVGAIKTADIGSESAV
jgi:hypothetical protein